MVVILDMIYVLEKIESDGIRYTNCVSNQYIDIKKQALYELYKNENVELFLSEWNRGMCVVGCRKLNISSFYNTNWENHMFYSDCIES